MELQSRYADLQAQGLGLTVITYDPAETLRGYDGDSEVSSIRSCQDGGSAVIREYDLLKRELDPDRRF